MTDIEKLKRLAKAGQDIGNSDDILDLIRQLEEARAENARLREALIIAEKSESDHENCEECDDTIEAELCEFCFPAADKARLARWDALGINQPRPAQLEIEDEP